MWSINVNINFRNFDKVVVEQNQDDTEQNVGYFYRDIFFIE